MIANKEYLKYLKAKPLHFQFTLYPFCIDFCTALLNNILDDHRKTRTAILQTLVEFIRRLNSWPISNTTPLFDSLFFYTHNRFNRTAEKKYI